MVHQWQYRTNWDSLAPIHDLIYQLESQGGISKTHSAFNSPICPVQNSDGGWRLTVVQWPEWSDTTTECCCTRHVTSPIWAGVKGNQVVCYNWHSQYIFFSSFGSRVQVTVFIHVDGCPIYLELTAQGSKHSLTICHGLIKLNWKRVMPLNIYNTLTTSFCGARQQKFLKKCRK